MAPPASSRSEQWCDPVALSMTIELVVLIFLGYLDDEATVRFGPPAICGSQELLATVCEGGELILWQVLTTAQICKKGEILEEC